MTLISMHDVWINAEFTENNLGHMAPGTPAEIVLDSRPGRVFRGRVRSVGLGVGWGQANQPGTLPAIDNNRDWLRQAQRFPVIVEIDPDQASEMEGLLRVGGQATVITYNGGGWHLKLLGKLFIRIQALLSYAY
jgi:multidrug resistance efflux pump